MAVRRVRTVLLASAIAAVGSVVVLPPGPALAVSLAVNSTADLPDTNLDDGICLASNGSCTLRAAVEQTNALVGMDSVSVPAGTYLLGDPIVVEDSLFLTAPDGATATVFDGQDSTTVLQVRTSELLVCDSGGDSVEGYDRNGSRNGGVVSSGSGGLDTPVAVTPDQNDLFVTGLTSGVSRYDGVTGVFEGVFAALGEGGLVGPSDAVANGEDMLVADYIGGDVLRYDRLTGAYVGVFAAAGSGGLAQPNSLLARGSEVLVTSAGSDSVLRYNEDTGAFLGALVPTSSGGLDVPRGLVVRDGSLYVASWENDRVLRYDASTGAYLGNFVTPGSGGLDRPTDLLFSRDGDLLVLSSATRQVLRYDGATGAYEGVHVQGTDGSPLMDHPACLAERFGAGDGPIVNASGLTLRNGRGDIGEAGAGFYVDGGASVSLRDSVVRDNHSSVFGGGVSNWGTLEILRSEVRENALPPGGGGQTSQGGGIFNNGNLRLHDSTVTGNTATRGGGISTLKRAELVNVTVSGNRALGGGGGGIRNASDDAVLNLSFVTITDNAANEPSSDAGSEMNRYGGGLLNQGDDAQVNMANSIIAENRDNRFEGDTGFSPDCWSPNEFRFTSHRDNLIGVMTDDCVLRDSTWGDLRNIEFGTPDEPLDPRLGVLMTNGGPVRTHALLSSSPAIDADAAVTSATLFDCIDRDARQQPRPLDGDVDGTARCDLGAYEYQPVTDGDGVSPDVEDDAPGGGDGNGDGIPDRLQPSVASLPAGPEGDYVTLVASEGSVLQSVATVPVPAGKPDAVELPLGTFTFSVTADPEAEVTVILPPGTDPEAWWKHGPRPGMPMPAWYEFGISGGTGATISGDTVTLHLRDGERGDSDLAVNGVVVDPGGPAAVLRCNGMMATVVGTEGEDRLRGTDGPDVIVGLGGDDRIRGDDGDDVICAGAGDDWVRGGDGDDLLFGDDGVDRLHGDKGDDLLDGMDDDSVTG